MPDTHGDLAIVLHSHMPYVEGFGTYPFGEEWLFDAVIRSYLPLLEFAHDLTFTMTPVLADQLEDEATAERLRTFLLEHRIEAAQRDAGEVQRECRPAAEAEAARFRRALDVLDGFGGNPLAPFQRAAREGRIAVAASAATHAILPLIATRAGRRLQIDAGLRSHRRRFTDWEGGFWLPECAYEPGLEWLLAEHGIEWFCVDQSAHEPPSESLRPVRTDAGPLAFTLDWEAIEWLWSWGGYPSHPDYAEFDGKSMRGTRIWRIGGGAYRPEDAEVAAREQAAEFARAVAERLAGYRETAGRRGLIVFAVDTELLGHWWWEGPIWLEEALRQLPSAGVRLVTLDQVAESASGAGGAAAPSGTNPASVAPGGPGPVEPRRGVELAASTWGEAKDFRTWDSPAVSDFVWSARRLELRLVQELGCLSDDRARRAARELLAVQSSDWAFLDFHGKAGDYAFERATQHAEALLEALDCRGPRSPEARLRALAPDMSLAPLQET